MAKFVLAFMVCWAGLLQTAYARCPPISSENRYYNQGERLRLQCADRPGVYYETVCGANSFWNHVDRDSKCRSPSPHSDGQVYNPPAPAAPRPKPVAVAPKPKGCAFIPELMRDADANRIWPTGTRYGMRCRDNKRRYFIAECVNEAWLFQPNYCQGPSPAGTVYFGPMQAGPQGPQPAKPYDDSGEKHSGKPFGQGLFDGISDALGNLFQPRQDGEESSEGLNLNFRGLLDPVFGILNPKPDRPAMDYSNYEYCPYNENYMDIEYRGKVFSHHYKYRAECPGGEHEGRYFVLVCDNGVWKYDVKDCESINSFFTLAFNEYPYWLLSLFLRG